MSEAEPRGQLLVAGKPPTPLQISRLAGCDAGDAQKWIAELRAANVFSVLPSGIIYSRKMIRDTLKSASQRAKAQKRWTKASVENIDENRFGNAEGYAEPMPQKPQPEKELSDAYASSSGAVEPAPAITAKCDDVKVAFDEWNVLAGECGLPKARTLDQRRRKAISTRLADGGLVAWREALAAVGRSPFCVGDNNRAWKADLDFVCKAQSWNRLLEGAYGGGAAPAEVIVRPTWTGPADVRAAIVADLSEGFAFSWLDRCGWGPGETIRASNKLTADRLIRDASSTLDRLGVTIIIDGEAPCLPTEVTTAGIASPRSGLRAAIESVMV